MEASVSRPAAASPWTRAVDLLERLPASPLFAYGSIFAIQAKVLWGIWIYRDLSPGDTGSYFDMARNWAQHFLVDPAFYPAYHVLWGSMTWVIPDPYSVTIVHRVLIVFGTTLLLLAVLRRLLTPGIAWALALWWAVLPVNYDVLYEIHLFGALAGLAIALVALRWSGLAGRSAVFGLLLAASLLVRNEDIVAAFTFGVIWLGYEGWRLRKRSGPPVSRLAAAVVIPLLSFAALIGVLQWRSTSSESVFSQLSHKHRVNVCQAYAQELWQAGDRLVANPEAQCFAYTLRDFGVKFPSLPQAIADNPGAMARHFARNAKLVPAGLEVDLFNAKYGSTSEASNPDYIPVSNGSWVVLAGSIAVLAIIVSGVVLVWKDRRRWWDGWIRQRAWGWAAMVSLGSSALYAALLTRPRPSYMFPLSVLIFALIGMSLVVIVSRLGLPARWRAAIPVLAVAAFILVPPHYRHGYQNPQIGSGQRLKEAVSRLEPYRTLLTGGHTLLGEYPTTVACQYVGQTDPCWPVSWNNPIGQNLAPELAGKNEQSFSPRPIDVIYADEAVFREDPSVRSQLDRLVGHGWHEVSPASQGSNWMLLARDRRATSS
jgi:hypothetical protein